jgi:hypothetical protein
MKPPKNSADRAASAGCVARLVRFFDSLLKWIAQKESPLGPIEVMLAVAVLVMSVAVFMLTAAVSIRIISGKETTKASLQQESVLPEKQTKKGERE